MKKFSFRMWLAALLGALAFIGGTGLTISSGWLITVASEHPPILTLTVAIVMVRFFGIFRSVARYGERILSHEAVFRRLTALRVSLFEKLSAKKITLVRDVNSGASVKAIVDDVERAQEFQLRVSLPMRAAYISLGVGIGLGYWINPRTLAITIPASVLTLWVIPKLISLICFKSAEKIELLENDYAQSLQSASQGLIEAQIYGYLQKSLDYSHSLELDISKQERALARKSAMAQFATLLTIAISIVGTSFMAYKLVDVDLIPSVGITMLIFLPLVFFEPITSWYPNLFAAGKMLVAQRRVDELATAVDSHIKMGASLLERVKELSLRDVRVSWGTEFMAPVSFTVTPGNAIVLRGPSGVGKSTLAKGILGLLPYRGSAMINGCEISEISNLDHLISGTLQHGHIFNTSIRENLKIADHCATDAKLLRVLEMVELNQISLDTIVGDFGRTLSGGEAKRLGLARALLSPAPILVLDEPTEHLDTELAQRIEHRVLEHFADRALIIITHSGWGITGRTITLGRE